MTDSPAHDLSLAKTMQKINELLHNLFPTLMQWVMIISLAGKWQNQAKITPHSKQERIL